MDEAQLGGVQCQSRSATDIFDSFCSERLVVFQVAADHAPFLCEMDANLVRAAGFQSAFDLAVIAELFHPPHVSYRSLADFAVQDATPASVTAVTNQIRDDRPVLRAAVNNGPVDPVNGVFAKLAHKMGFRLFISREHQDTAGIAIQAMDAADRRQSNARSISLGNALGE